ncbi:MAG TPA: succinate dehydrogenase, cytochrome b556 subunit [Candidatus Azoamicus sp.]
MKSKHVFLNLFFIKFPITAITSIIHRVTGIFLFLCIPIFLYFLKISLASESSFLLAKNLFNSLYIKFFLFVFLSSFIYHFVMGVKHIIMDLGYFEGKNSSNNFALFALIFSLLLIFLSILV